MTLLRDMMKQSLFVDDGIKLREIGTIQINKGQEDKIVQLNFVLNVYQSNYLE